jgi:UDP-N-acetylglucosamine 4-epimerase
MEFNSYHSNWDLSKHSFLITGGAGFIGSNLTEYLVKFGAGKIRILDNLSTGNLDNIKDFINLPNVEFFEGDIRSYSSCVKALKGIDFVSHQAALGSVPRSINDPITSNEVNINGFLNILNAAKEENVIRMVYAASSSTYGDSKILPKEESVIGNPLSPYAVTKYVNELYAQVFSKTYGFNTIGLRYFNVFGPKQNLKGPYAAVIPLFITQMLKNEQPFINGNGESSRDFTYIANVVQANIKSFLKGTLNTPLILNVAYGEQVSLLKLVSTINNKLGTNITPQFRDFREGDVMHSLADINKARIELGYNPEYSFEMGIEQTIPFYKDTLI